MERLLIALIGVIGTIVGGLFTFLYQKRSADNEKMKIEGDLRLQDKRAAKEFDIKGFEVFRNAYKEDMKDFSERLIAAEAAEKKCLENYENLNKQYIELKTALQLLQMSLPTIPTPMWTKSDTGIMLSLNDEYERRYLTPLGFTKSDYIGKTDIEFWGEEIGKVYHKNDLKVMESKKTQVYVEPLKTLKGIESVIVIKYVRTIEDKFVVGIGGLALDFVLGEEIVSKIQTYNKENPNLN